MLSGQIPQSCISLNVARASLQNSCCTYPAIKEVQETTSFSSSISRIIRALSSQPYLEYISINTPLTYISDSKPVFMHNE
uniref:Uncharacterized protein n=1 Tax=Arundo donax TaxID=35708 RepID=A0A0A8ZYH9_ARUDO